jgi:hypothetical protein
LIVSKISTHNTLSSLSHQKQREITRDSQDQAVRMPRMDLTDLIVALLHCVAAPCHRRRGCRGGRCHRRPAPAPPQTLMASATPNPRVLERPPSPSPDRSAYWPMEPSDRNASPRGRQGRPCAVHGWGPCPYPVALAVGSSSRGYEGRRREKKKKNHNGSRSSTTYSKGC